MLCGLRHRCIFACVFFCDRDFYSAKIFAQFTNRSFHPLAHMFVLVIAVLHLYLLPIYGNSIQPVIVYKQSWVTWQEDPSKYHGLVSSFIIFYLHRLIVHAILHQFLGFIICWFLACYLVMVSPNTLCCLPLFFLLYCWSSNKNWLV
jgi:hypothetical protein